MSWRKKATDELTDDDELLMIQQFVFYMEELIKLLRQPNPNIEEIINWLESEVMTAAKEMGDWEE